MTRLPIPALAACSQLTPDLAIVPDPTLTPGAVRTTDPVEIGEHGTRELRHWDRARDDRIMAEYGCRSPSGARQRGRMLLPAG